jgi:Ca2+-binding RTX toxin-like protein
MANIVGTSFRDFIHRAGDGFVAGAGDNGIATVTVGADTIDAGIGDDFIHADAENDSIIAGAGATWSSPRREPTPCPAEMGSTLSGAGRAPIP